MAEWGLELRLLTPEVGMGVCRAGSQEPRPSSGSFPWGRSEQQPRKGGAGHFQAVMSALEEEPPLAVAVL